MVSSIGTWRYAPGTSVENIVPFKILFNDNIKKIVLVSTVGELVSLN